MILRNRVFAAELLAEKLSDIKTTNPLVLGIPRGAMPMAKVIADKLNAELGAVLVHKIPAPGNEEYAIGCVGLSGKIHLSPYVSKREIPESYINQAAKRQLQVLERRKRMYGLGDPKIEGRSVIIVDDGIATGETTTCAIKEVREFGPKEIILACGVSSMDAASRIKPLVESFIVLGTPEGFYSVGQFFSDFSQVNDEEVVQILHPEQGESSAWT